MVTLTINGEPREIDANPDMPLLWVLRDELKMTGTKFGCGVASCGACTVHIDGEPTRSCQALIGDLEGANVTTIEAIDTPAAKAIQAAWVELQVPQCGYCQSGMLMAAAALLREHPNPSDSEINGAMNNICVCGTYQRVRAAIHRAASLLGGAP